MHICIVHNYYRQSGGEDAVVDAESNLLAQYEHQVTRYTVSNQEVNSYSKLALAGATIWNHPQYRRMRRLFREQRPNIVHVHNTLPLISPAVYYAAKAENIPVVQMLHNYRPFCLNGVLYRDGHVCEDCLGHFPVHGLRHKCYRGSLGASSGVFAIYALYYAYLKTYQTHVATFIASTQFAKKLFARMGLDENKIVVKPNLVRIADVPEAGISATSNDVYDVEALFVGRLDARKGIWTLLSAIERARIPLTLVGDGNLRPQIQSWLGERPELDVKITGWLDAVEVAKRLKSASMLIVPSEFYESFGNVIVEAFACGVPVLTTSIGAQAELVRHERTGLLFAPGDAEELAKLIKLLVDDPEKRQMLGENARAEFEARYTSEQNYQLLMNIYAEAMESRR